MKRFFLVEDSPFSRSSIQSRAGATFPVHSHDLDGQLSIQVIEGDGVFLGADGAEIAAKTGDILISDESRSRTASGPPATCGWW